MLNAAMTMRAMSVVAALLAMTSSALAATSHSPQEWLQRMTHAMSELDFEGTVVRRQNGESEALKLVHKLVDGVVNERIVSQEGNGLEIIRVGNEVHCIVPDKKSVLIEHWNDQTTVLPKIPDDASLIGPQYHLSVVREERVAGRMAVLLAIRPVDEYRYGQWFWLDRETAFPLRADLKDSNGVLLQQIKFADIRLGTDISPSALKPSLDLDGFTWYTDRSATAGVPVETDWVAGELPAGFRAISTESEQLTVKESPVTHIVYGDGLATVSVFIAPKKDDAAPGASSIGATNTYSADGGEVMITAVGKVPAATVKSIAQSMSRR